MCGPSWSAAEGSRCKSALRSCPLVTITLVALVEEPPNFSPNEAVFALPHLGPEGLTVVDAEHIAVVNDNNFPYSSGHTIGKPDDNEITLLNIKALVDAR